MADLNRLKDEAAEAILTQIKEQADGTNAEMLKQLAEAYALVVAQGGDPLKRPPMRVM
ncbi:MAG: hypothetical protein L0L50_02350 [Propionibacterium sp.]|nr:hypothetical protein [Propionibacterium sp.]